MRSICSEDAFKRDVVSGYAEMVKYGLILDKRFYNYLSGHMELILNGCGSAMMKSVARCIQLKCRVVEKDERDLSGSREILNFGHSFGHALENVAGYGYFRHGEALVWGMRFAKLLSVLQKMLSREVAVELDEMLAKIPVPKIPYDIREGAVLAALEKDKKRKGGQLRFVLLKDVGVAVSGVEVKKESVMRAFKSLGSRGAI